MRDVGRDDATALELAEVASERADERIERLGDVAVIAVGMVGQVTDKGAGDDSARFSAASAGAAGGWQPATASRALCADLSVSTCDPDISAPPREGDGRTNPQAL